MAYEQRMHEVHEGEKGTGESLRSALRRWRRSWFQNLLVLIVIINGGLTIASHNFTKKTERTNDFESLSLQRLF